ncbi:2-phosphosulfolactate phosphatase [Peribacillus sp. NPDC097264]|uniref:2-phosphosulfolactate phosphatase n=1 Tax=unclassified Peribacillus TaxID=2675266 RepID=UPI00388EAEB4
MKQTMQHIHLLLKKEEINRDKLLDGEKVAIVLDVLLATTTIVSALHNGAEQVIPVLSPADAELKSKDMTQGECLLAGEMRAQPIEGFIYPSPTLLNKLVQGKTLVLSTTNGTVALQKSSSAKKVYIASLLNNPSVAEKIKNVHQTETIVIVCSGNSGEFSMEDFYGAGHLIHCLVNGTQDAFLLNDAAKAACAFYSTNINSAFEILQTSHVGQLFENHDLNGDLRLATQKGSITLVPELINGKIQTVKNRQQR